jgi:hypothetical protein
MKLFILTLCFTSLTQAQVLISGYDDVLRQSNNTSLFNVVKHFFKKDQSYTGMNRLYRIILERTQQKKFHLLSATPNLLDNHVSSFLKTQDYPPVEIHLRNILTNPFITRYRLQQLSEICPKKDCIWITDTSDSILELIKDLKDWKGDIYLRETVKKEYPPGTKPFITTFDLAQHQLLSGRASKKDVESVLVDLLAESNSELLVPNFAYCPEDYDPCGFKIFALCERFKLKIQTICSTRKERKEL